MLRANLSSVLPPVFRELSLHSAGTGLIRLHLPQAGHIPFCPIPLPCNAGKTLKPTWRIRRLGPLLEGYFHNPFTKICTVHLLSLHRVTMYSSLSLHFLIVKNLNTL